MRRTLHGVVLGTAVLFAQVAVAGEPAPAVDAKAVFEQLKAVAGEWEGTGSQGKESFPAAVHYRVASGGTVVEEKLAVGTPHEELRFVFVDGTNLDVAKDHHIHGLTLRLSSDGLHHEWRSWQGGKEAEQPLRIALRRKGPAGGKAAQAAPAAHQHP
jgi:hypothetical protein